MLKLKTAYQTIKGKLRHHVDAVIRNEDGATLVEYSILIGLITVATVAIIYAVGQWIVTQWQALIDAVQ